MLRKKKTEQNDDFFSDGNDVGAVEHEPMPDYKPVKKKSSNSRVLLLLLLLVAIAGGGYFFLLGPVEEPTPPPAPAPARRPIPAQPPAAVPAAVENQGAAPASAPNAAAQAPAPTAPPIAGKAASAAPEQPAASKPAPAAPVAVKEPVAPAADKRAPTAEKAEPAAAAKIAPAPAAGKYAIEAGAFLMKANRQAAEKIIRRLGFKPEITTIHRPVKMMRLRLGGPYTPMAAELKLAELASLAPGAFSVPNGDEMIVYAGSFFLLDEARILADKLYREGIRVEEEAAQVTMPLEVVSFGSFSSKKAAAEALAKAKAAGLEPVVVRK